MQHRSYLSLIVVLIVAALSLSTQPAIGQNELQNWEPRIDIAEPQESQRSDVFSAPANNNKIHQWQDGNNNTSLYESDDLVMERYDGSKQSERSVAAMAAEDVIASDGRLRIVKKQERHQQSDEVYPVLVTSMGGWKALPGGVLVVLDPEMETAEIDAFFAELDTGEISEMDFTKNAFFIETEPGIVGLELSNKLAKMKEVKLSSPNWWTPVELR